MRSVSGAMPAGGSALRRTLASLCAVVMIAAGLVAVSQAGPASAFSVSEFQAGNIISDANFYDSNAMTEAQIQKFLNAQIGTCQNTLCLNVYKQTTISRAQDRTVCNAYAGAANEPAARIIFKVQQACGISAKVILVTLQKEQGLVQKSSPTSGTLGRAMGYACPDHTGGTCDSTYYGFFNQVYWGSWQLKRYSTPDVFGGFWAGQSRNILYSPNTTCRPSSKWVTIKNRATAALYSYTPYTPTAAALAAYPAAAKGDDAACGSYGNRNFWFLYYQWFGSPIEIPCTANPGQDITRYWEDQGGSSGPFGASVSPGIVAGQAGTTIGYYANGDVYCTARIGAAGVLGDIRVKYNALGGVSSSLGSPLTTRVSYSAGGVSGLLQEFQRGTMMSSATTGTFAVLDGPMRKAWGARGGSGGSLGWPTGDQESFAGGVWQQFQHGVITVPTGQPAIVLTGGIATYWDAATNASRLGTPLADLVTWSAGGVSGSYQVFERGMVMSSATTGTFAVLGGPIRNAWSAKDGSGGSLGWPTGDQGTYSGGVWQQFQHGVVTVPTGKSAIILTGEIAGYWSAATNASRLGTPVAPSVPWSAGGVSGVLQYFERGMVLSSAVTGTFAVLNGPIRKAWGAQGGSGGSLGWPTGDQESYAGGVRQQFQGNTLAVGNGLTGEIAGYWATATNASRLGTPVAPSVPWSTGGVSGVLQYFERGMVLSSAVTGTFAVLNGPIRSAWGAHGGSGGSLGWPTGDQESYTGGVRQQFQGGIVMVPSGRAGSVLSGETASYWSTGANASRLGSPVSSSSAWSAGGVSGVLQYFERGMVLSSAVTGTFAVLNGPIRSAWGVQGGSGGSFGWPTGDQESYAGGVRQQFQGGIITISAAGVAIALAGDYYQYWSAKSNGALLGSPIASAVSWSAGGVSGSYQVFERGMVMSSVATGTFAVLDGQIRSAWSAQDGSRGSLGWPTGDQVSSAGGVSQNFDGGTLTISAEGVVITLTGDYFVYWKAGSNTSVLGQSVAPVVPWSAGGVSGSYQVFERGMVMSSVTTGMFAVLDGPIRTVWGRQDGSGGPLGWPTADQATVPGGIRQQFQHGSVMVPTTGTPYFTLN